MKKKKEKVVNKSAEKLKDLNGLVQKKIIIKGMLSF